MLASIFRSFIESAFPALAKKITEKVNDKEQEIRPEYKNYLKPEYSVDMKFNSLQSNNSIVAADVVALDSELPLKSRGSHKSATGEIPKLGMIKAMNESMLQALKNLKARGGKAAEITTKLFQDAGDSVKGVYERLDIMFYQAVSTGVTLVDDDKNTGTGIRVDFGIPAGNQFNATVSTWDQLDAEPITDIDVIITAARNAGHSLKYMFIDKVTYNAFKVNAQVKEAFAGFLKINSSQIFRLSNEDVQTIITDQFGLQIIIVDKVVQIEKNGVKTAYEPWTRGNVTFTTSTDLGTLTYGELAEVDHKVDGVEYQTIDNFILVSMFRTNNPLKENTSVQALALPVLNNTDSMYILETTAEQSDDDTQTEGNTGFLYNGATYTVVSVVDGINAARAEDDHIPVATTSQTDATLAGKIKKMSEAGLALFEAEIVLGGV